MKWIQCILLSVIFSVGCSTVADQPRAPLALPNPAALTMRPLTWSILPIAGKTAKDKSVVIFGLTEGSYKNLAENMRDITNFIILQRQIIDEYRKYYESPTPTETPAR